MSEIRMRKYAFLGGGIIAGVFIERLLRGGGVAPANVLATDIRRERLDLLSSQFGIRVSANNGEGAGFGDVVFLAVPPNAVKPVLTEVREKLQSGVLVVSLAAAVPTSLIEEAAGRPVSVVRVIPNTPSLIGRGMNPHCLGKYVSEEQWPLIQALLATFGETIRVDEALMEAATALTAVGPAYVFPVIKAMTEAAVGLGLPADQARFAAAQTVAGAAQLVLETGQDPEVLKLMIGVRTLKEDEARALFAAALEAAHEKIAAARNKLAPAG
jgi:pyrroline-5-carboxylate reductase